MYLKYKFQLDRAYLSQIHLYKGQPYILEKIPCSIYKHHSRTVTVNTYKPTTSSQEHK